MSSVPCDRSICPFPGMDPFLEQRDEWHSFHTMFLARALIDLKPQLPAGYSLRLEKWLKMTADHDVIGSTQADVAVTDARRSESPQSFGGTASSLVITCTLDATEIVPDAEEQSVIQIIGPDRQTAITIVELLSYANKAGDGGDQFAMKRQDILRSSSSYVEIDLLRFGNGFPVPERSHAAYAAVVCDQQSWPALGYWPIELREPLPDLPIPLAAPDPPLTLHLQRVLDMTMALYDYGSDIY